MIKTYQIHSLNQFFSVFLQQFETPNTVWTRVNERTLVWTIFLAEERGHLAYFLTCNFLFFKYFLLLLFTDGLAFFSENWESTQLDQMTKTHQFLKWKIREIDWSYLCLKQFKMDAITLITGGVNYVNLLKFAWNMSWNYMKWSYLWRILTIWNLCAA